MKKIEAIIKPCALERVKAALAGIGVLGLTVTEARWFGSEESSTEVYRGIAYVLDFVPKIKIETVVEDHQASHVVRAVLNAVSTGKAGDGKVFVVPIEEAVRIRTGETGAVAVL